MNEKYLEEYCQGFMDKCAASGLTQKQSEELLKQAYGGLLRLLPKAWKGIKSIGPWAAKNKGSIALNTALIAGPTAYSYLAGSGGAPEQQQQQPAGVPGYQPPQRQYGSPKLNVKGMGGITPYLT
jgi:hypothetical protein